MKRKQKKKKKESKEKTKNENKKVDETKESSIKKEANKTKQIQFSFIIFKYKIIKIIFNYFLNYYQNLHFLNHIY